MQLIATVDKLFNKLRFIEIRSISFAGILEVGSIVVDAYSQPEMENARPSRHAERSFHWTKKKTRSANEADFWWLQMSWGLHSAVAAEWWGQPERFSQLTHSCAQS